MGKQANTIGFSATLRRPATPENAAWLFLVVPAAASAGLPTRAMVSVEGMLEGQSFKATLEPDGQGSHWLKVPRALQQKARIAAGDNVAVEIAPTGGTPEPGVPPDLRSALAAAPAARTQWDSLTPIARRDWIHWITSAKKAETRDRRIANTADMLVSGKRRVCCFDRSGMYSKAFGAPEARED